MLKSSVNAGRVAASLLRKAGAVARRSAASRVSRLADGLRSDDSVSAAGIEVSRDDEGVLLRGPDLYRRLIEDPDLRDLKRHLQ